jgi:hypothetical protein
MVEDRPEDIESSPDSGRAKRAPPTIDLEATEVSGAAQNAGSGGEPRRSFQWPWLAAIPSTIMSAASGAGAAALVIGVAWLLGWPGEAAPPAAPAAPPVNAAAIDDLAARIGGLESKTGRPAASAADPATAARVDALDKSLATLRGELPGLRGQLGNLEVAVNEFKAPPRGSAAPPDLTAINERIAGIEAAMRAQGSVIAQESAKPADDAPLRRIVAAALLDVQVRTGDPYPAALAAAKSLAASPDALKPLDDFATSGVPSAAVLCRELLMLVPKLSPPARENSTTGSSLVDRLQAGAAKLVRIERTDTNGNDPGNVVARATAAALRNDYNEARHELNTLAPADRAAAQAWIDKANARDAALAASRQFAAEAMTALATPGR